MNKNVKTTVGLIIGFIIGFTIVELVMNSLRSPASFDKQLMIIAEKLNKTCPFMVDRDTRLDNAIGGPGKNFTYNYTVVNYAAEEIDADQVKSNIYPAMLNDIKTNPDIEIFRKNEVTLIYKYKDKNGKFLFDIEISPEDYK